MKTSRARALADQAYSLRIPNEDGSFTNYGIDWLTSTAVPLFTGAEWAKLGNGEGTGDPLNDAVTALSHIAEPIINMSLMQGVENALSAWNMQKQIKQVHFCLLQQQAMLPRASRPFSAKLPVELTILGEAHIPIRPASAEILRTPKTRLRTSSPDCP